MNYSSLLVQGTVIGCSFTLVCQGYGNHHCHIKTRERRYGGSVDDVMSGRDGPGNLRILKKSQLRVEIGPCRQRVELSTVAAAVKCFGSLPAGMNWHLKHHAMYRTLGVGFSMVWLRKTFDSCVSLLVSMNWIQEIDKPFVSEQQSPPVFACICICLYSPVFCTCICICIVIQLWLISSRYATWSKADKRDQRCASPGAGWSNLIGQRPIKLLLGNYWYLEERRLLMSWKTAIERLSCL